MVLVVRSCVIGYSQVPDMMADSTQAPGTEGARVRPGGLRPSRSRVWGARNRLFDMGGADWCLLDAQYTPDEQLWGALKEELSEVRVLGARSIRSQSVGTHQLHCEATRLLARHHYLAE